MKLTISLLFLFCAIIAAKDLFSTDPETLETPYKYCGIKLSKAMSFYCEKENYDRIKNILGDSEKGENLIEIY